jgi:TPR repeat protein
MSELSVHRKTTHPLSLETVISGITLLTILVLSTVAFAESKTFTATHTYILGDSDSKDDARQRCLLEVKRKILEQAGVYIESASEVKNFDLMKDKIASFAAAVMHITETKEEVGFQQGHMTLTLKVNAQVDVTEMRKQLAARHVEGNVRDDVTAQKERLQSLEAQVKAMQGRNSSETASGSPPNDQDLQKWHAQAAEGAAKGHATDQVFLAILYHKGVGVPQDYAQAVKWYERAAIQGNAQAISLLALLYYLGDEIPQDYGKAREWYEQGAALGYADAQYGLGVMYAEGKGVPQDYGKAREWYEKAAAQGYAEAQSNLGLLYNLGYGVAQDYATARHWYELAAKQGNAGAQNNLGRLYFLAQGVPQNYTIARHWFEKAAAQGSAQSQSYLGNMYFFGHGVPKDYKMARLMLVKAATQEDGKSQALLGLIYASGAGVPQNYVKAHMWTSLSAANAENDAQRNVSTDLRNQIERRMTPAQIADAQQLAQQCQSQQFKGCN